MFYEITLKKNFFLLFAKNVLTVDYLLEKSTAKF